jgi:lysine biosynthesis protein LysW
MGRRIRKAIMSRCVECDSRVYFDKMPELGYIVTCRECGTKLEVIDHDPIELDWLEDGAGEIMDYSDYDAYDY